MDSTETYFNLDTFQRLWRLKKPMYFRIFFQIIKMLCREMQKKYSKRIAFQLNFFNVAKISDPGV